MNLSLGLHHFLIPVTRPKTSLCEKRCESVVFFVFLLLFLFGFFSTSVPIELISLADLFEYRFYIDREHGTRNPQPPHNRYVDALNEE